MLSGVVVDNLCERVFKTELMHSALGSVYVVRKGKYIFDVGAVVLQCDFRDGIVLRAAHIYNLVKRIS